MCVGGMVGAFSKGVEGTGPNLQMGEPKLTPHNPKTANRPFSR